MKTVENCVTSVRVNIIISVGAFFIAVLQKKAILPWQKYAPLAGIRLKPHQMFASDPLVPFAKENPETWATIKTFFNISPDFPTVRPVRP